MYKLWVTDLEKGSFVVEGLYAELIALKEILSRHYHRDNFVICNPEGKPVI
jgi:hypothetical protein